MKKSDEIEIKTFNLVFSFIESILARFKSKNIKNPTTFLAGELGTSKSYISKAFNGEGNFTVKTLISIANAADLEVELLLRDRNTAKVFKYMQIATVDTEEHIETTEQLNLLYQTLILRTLSADINRWNSVTDRGLQLTMIKHANSLSSQKTVFA